MRSPGAQWIVWNSTARARRQPSLARRKAGCSLKTFRFRCTQISALMSFGQIERTWMKERQKIISWERGSAAACALWNKRIGSFVWVDLKLLVGVLSWNEVALIFYPSIASRNKGERVVLFCYPFTLVFHNCRWHCFVSVPPYLVPRPSAHCYAQPLQEHRMDSQSWRSLKMCKGRPFTIQTDRFSHIWKPNLQKCWWRWPLTNTYPNTPRVSFQHCTDIQ